MAQGVVGAPGELAEVVVQTTSLSRLESTSRMVQGVVYEAWQNSVERAVALKVLPGAVAADDKAFHRFMREARTAANLSHPNIVGVHGMGQEENTPYYAMEYVDGDTLAQILSKLKGAEPETKTPFGPTDEVAYFGNLAKAFADVADGLQHAHSKGVVHRDIKPSNLILDNEGRVRILDFGLARLEGQDSLTVSGDFVGTPAYMSPEQARRRKIPVDHRTDVYSFGATLYELLTHEQPFRGKDYNDTLSQIIERDPRPPRQLNGRVPQDLETIVLKCLRKDAADRYGTAEALGQDLRRFVRGDPVEAKPPLAWERWRHGLWRNRRRVSFAVLAVLVLSMTAVVAFGLLREARRHRNATYRQRIAEAMNQVGLARSYSLISETQRSEMQDRAEYFLGKSLQLDREKEKRLRAATRMLEEARRISPDSPEAYYHGARIAFMRGREAKSIEQLERALRVAPGFPAAGGLLAAIHEARGAPQRARETLGAFREPGQSASAERWFRAETGRLAGNWEQAETSFGEILRLRAYENQFVRSDAEALIGRGLVRMKMNEYQDAILDFRAAMALTQEDLSTAILLGYCELLKGSPAGLHAAGRWFRSIFASVPSHRSDEAALAIASTYFVVRDFEEALTWTREMTSIVERTRNEVYLLVELGRFLEAFALAQEFPESAAEDAHILSLRGYATAHVLGHETEANDLIEQALKLDSESPSVIGLSLLGKAMMGDAAGGDQTCEDDGDDRS